MTTPFISPAIRSRLRSLLPSQQKHLAAMFRKMAKSQMELAIGLGTVVSELEEAEKRQAAFRKEDRA